MEGRKKKKKLKNQTSFLYEQHQKPFPFQPFPYFGSGIFQLFSERRNYYYYYLSFFSMVLKEKKKRRKRGT